MAHATSTAIGSPYAFAAAMLVVVAWAACGPVFHYSDTWQLVINTGTTVVTFLVVFMIQNTQNRDSRAIHLKLDELIRAVDAARNRLVDIENLPDEELARLAQEFQRVRDQPDPGPRRDRNEPSPQRDRNAPGPVRDSREPSPQRDSHEPGPLRDSHEPGPQRDQPAAHAEKPRGRRKPGTAQH